MPNSKDFSSKDSSIKKIFEIVKNNEIKFIDFRFTDYTGKWLHISYSAEEVSEEELVKRLLGRGLTSGRSDDTNETIIRARIQEYHDKTTAVATYYKQFDKVVSVQGEGTVESIYADLKTEIDKRIKQFYKIA